MLVTLSIHEMEPGTHIARKPIREVYSSDIDLPDEECREVRPDWGVYVTPLVTFRAIERALRKRRMLTYLPPNYEYRMAVKGDK